MLTSPPSSTFELILQPSILTTIGQDRCCLILFLDYFQVARGLPTGVDVGTAVGVV
jgi:hypothetical protein